MRGLSVDFDCLLAKEFATAPRLSRSHSSFCPHQQPTPTPSLRRALTALERGVRLVWLRVVRHLPARHDSAGHANGLRAGVGQASKEETAECTAAAQEGYEAMGIRATAIGAADVDGGARWSMAWMERGESGSAQ